MEHKSDDDTNCNCCALRLYKQQRVGKQTEKIANNNTSWDYPNDSTVKISQNTEKSPGNLKKTCCRSNFSEDDQLMLVWKTLKGLE